MKNVKLLSLLIIMGLPLQAKLGDNISAAVQNVQEWNQARRDRKQFLQDIRNENLDEIKKDIKDNQDVVDDTALFSGKKTALHILAEKNGGDTATRVKIVNYLLDNPYKKANSELKSNNGYTPLFAAVQSGNLSITEALLDKGAKPNITVSGGTTPLHMAAINISNTVAPRENDYKIAEKLLAKGAKVNAKDDQGNTPLDYANRAKSSTGTKLKTLLQGKGGKVGAAV